MKKSWELFEQLHAIPENKSDLKTYQELNILLRQLKNRLDSLGERELGDLKSSMDFLNDVDLSRPFLFGQCGDDVYWKIVDNVLYVQGRGPMWSFDNSVLAHKNNIYSPWYKACFHSVVILNGVTTIGSDAFNGAQISNVIIPSSIKKIERLAFFDASIDHLILPNTIEIIEEEIINGFSRVVDTLVLSVDIPDIRPYAFFNRDDILANNVYLTGNLPHNFTQLIESCLFDGAGSYQIYYPKEWDTENTSFFDRLAKEFDDSDNLFIQDLQKALIPYIN